MNRKLLSIVALALIALVLGVTGAGANSLWSTSSPSPSSSRLGSAVDATGPSLAPQAPLGSGFTYQGRLTLTGNPASGQYDLVFTIFDAATAGVRVGTPITVTNQTVTGGLFTVSLDFTAAAFQGSGRWLEMAVRQTGVGAYTTLSPRQALTAAPYALSLMPGAIITGSNLITLSAYNSGNGTGVYGSSTNGGGTGVYGTSIGGYGVYGTSTNSNGVYGTSNSSLGYGVYGSVSSGTTNAGVYGISSASNGAGVKGQADNGSLAYGVWGIAAQGYGVVGSSTSGYGVVGNSTSGYGLYGSSTSSAGMRGVSTNGDGVEGLSSDATKAGVNGFNGSGYGVLGGSTSSAGMRGVSTSGDGVQGLASNAAKAGVYGYNDNGYGVRGDSANGTGVYATSTNGTGVYAFSSGGTINDHSIGVFAQGDTGVYARTDSPYGEAVYAGTTVPGGGRVGYFDGDVTVVGSCCSSPIGIYQIDDPRDPANKYINQTALESPDLKNVYDGNVTSDANGNAVVTLPGYVGTINHDFRYQLTVIGQFAQAIVSSKIRDNSFTIKTDKPNVEVSWQVTGLRIDPYAQRHPVIAEQDKPANEKGYYQHPELYGQPDSKSVDQYVRNPLPIPAHADVPGGK